MMEMTEITQEQTAEKQKRLERFRCFGFPILIFAAGTAFLLYHCFIGAATTLEAVPPAVRKMLSNLKYRKSGTLRLLLQLLLAVYALWLLYLLFFRNRGTAPADPALWRLEHTNLIPFASVAEFSGYIMTGKDPAAVRSGIVNLAGNTVLFIPFGFLIPWLFEGFRKFRRTMLLMTASVTVVELLQLMTFRGSCDVDDLLLNLAGTAVGYLIFVKAAKGR